MGKLRQIFGTMDLSWNTRALQAPDTTLLDQIILEYFINQEIPNESIVDLAFTNCILYDLALNLLCMRLTSLKYLSFASCDFRFESKTLEPIYINTPHSSLTRISIERSISDRNTVDTEAIITDIFIKLTTLSNDQDIYYQLILDEQLKKYTSVNSEQAIYDSVTKYDSSQLKMHLVCMSVDTIDLSKTWLLKDQVLPQ